jgi:hypothetical protein
MIPVIKKYVRFLAGYRMIYLLLIAALLGRVEVKAQMGFSSYPNHLILFQEEYNAFDDEDTSKSIPIFLAIKPGLYFANSASSNYYNGTAKNPNGFLVIDEIFANPNNQRLFRDELGLSDTQFEGSSLEFNYNMRYDPGFLIGGEVFFGLYEKMWVKLGLSFVQLNTASIITLNVPNAPDQLEEDIRNLPVYGQEQRFAVDLGVNWLIGNNDLKGFLELGANFLSAQVKNNQFDIGSLTYSLMPTTNNLALNTINSFTFGAYLGGGLFYAVNPSMALTAGTQIAYNEVELPGYNGYFPQYTVFLSFIYLGRDNM